MVTPEIEQITSELRRPLKRVEYERLIELGVFDDEKIELLYGTIVQMSPQGNPHVWAVSRLNERLVLALRGRAILLPQSTVALTDDSVPEPDIALIPNDAFEKGHPFHPMLIVEVSESSLRKDRVVKTRLYAEAGVPEYWIVNLQESVFEVFREPVDGRYRHAETHGRGAILPLAAFPDVAVAVDEILPQKQK